MLTYIECLSCREMWHENAILDAVDGNEDDLIECISSELCPNCLAVTRATPFIDRNFRLNYSDLFGERA